MYLHANHMGRINKNSNQYLKGLGHEIEFNLFDYNGWF
jgi:hypothetical protein